MSQHQLPLAFLWQRKKEGGSVAETALNPYPATVGLDNVFDNRQTQAGASLLTRTRLVHAVKTLEDAMDCFRGNAGPVVPHEDLHLFTAEGARPDSHFALVPAILNGVVH